MKKIIFFALIVAAIAYFAMTCGESSMSISVRKHCNCAQNLVTTAAIPATDSAATAKVLNAYNEMVSCLGGEQAWKDLRFIDNTASSAELVKNLQKECPEVLETFQKLDIYSF